MDTESASRMQRPRATGEPPGGLAVDIHARLMCVYVYVDTCNTCMRVFYPCMSYVCTRVHTHVGIIYGKIRGVSMSNMCGCECVHVRMWHFSVCCVHRCTCAYAHVRLERSSIELRMYACTRMRMCKSIETCRDLYAYATHVCMCVRAYVPTNVRVSLDVV